MNPLAISIFIMSLAIGTTITISSHHWLLAWIGLEINTLALIPVMTKNPHPRAIEAATKYFLTQATASALVLFSALINAWQTGEWTITTLLNPSSINLSIALMMKLGLAPLHFWMPEVLQGIPLLSGLILSTWQKIAPMALMLQISQLVNLELMIIIGLTSILVGGWGGINQTQLRKIMAFSSIGHLGWMLIILKFNPQLTLLNFTLYLIMTSAMFLSLIISNTTKMQDISTMFTKTPILTSFTMLILLSLAGLPPLTGFTPKLLITMELIKQNAIFLASTIMFLSLLALFFYIRLTYILTLTLPPNTSYSTTLWYFKTKINPFVSPISSFALFIFPLSPSLLLLM
uniref:NADH-ubiquinone oxidoreductase chain 2 n=1 Tax=Mantella madagascariensis TaxID=111290 RepID=Q2HXI0_9NEOB|nr:NADH dehydrogenase subunit 2 [Mantella madagascariensis]BAE79515.1 NADH dehydrogenase subunit 2 [Mantella madagascariensis]